MNNNKYPIRLENIKDRKKRQKKIAKFRDQTNIYKIENNRLLIKKKIETKNHRKIKSNNNIIIENKANEFIESIEKFSLEDKSEKIENINNNHNLTNEKENFNRNIYNDTNKSININIRSNSIQYVWKKIPFQNEVIPLCENMHIATNHGGINTCQKALRNSEYFSEGYSSIMIKVIKNCTKCISLSNNVAERPAMKHIIPEGPHYRYQSDIWELSKKALKNITYKYILEIKDCFSKWKWCYQLENKEGQTILRKIKSYFLAFGPPKIFQTDNGLEFCNIITDLYLENMGVKHIRSSPRYPESNGQIESQH